QNLPRTLGGQSAERWIPVNAASRRRRWPKASVYRDLSPAKIGRRDRWRCSIACSPTQNIQRSGRQARRISADSHRRQHGLPFRHGILPRAAIASYSAAATRGAPPPSPAPAAAPPPPPAEAEADTAASPVARRPTRPVTANPVLPAAHD